MQEWIDQNGFEDRNALIRYANALVMKYGGTAGALACIMYEKTAEAQGKTVKTAEIAELPSYGEVAKAINGTMKETVKKVPSTVGRLTKQVGADTTIKNGIRDGAQFAWVPGGAETCAFCITLASRGWQYMSKKALKNGHAEHIHAGCDCQYAVRFDSSSNVAGYDPDKYLQMYEDASGTPKEKINEMRRKLYAEKNGLKLDDEGYAIRIKGNSNHGNTDFMGAARKFTDKGGTVDIKAYKVDKTENVYTQTNSKDAQGTIDFIEASRQEMEQLNSVNEIVVAKNLSGIAAYDHDSNRLYVNEKISDADYIEKQLSGGYFVAENATDVLRHEIHHKEHWDAIYRKALKTGKDIDIVKQEIEASLRSYVANQFIIQRSYIRDNVSENAERGYKSGNQLNEIIADVLLQKDKECVKDQNLLHLVEECIA